MDAHLARWLEKIEDRQDAHDESDKEQFEKVSGRIGSLETQMAKLMMIYGASIIIGGSVLSVVLSAVAKKLGWL